MPTLTETLLGLIVLSLAVLAVQAHRYVSLNQLQYRTSETVPPSRDTMLSPPHPGGHHDRAEPAPMDVYEWVRQHRIVSAPIPRIQLEDIGSEREHELLDLEFRPAANDADGPPEGEYSAVYARDAAEPLQLRSLVETLPPKRPCLRT